MVRRYRSGTVYQRKSDGRWIGSIPDGHGGRARYVTGTSKADVEKRLSEAARSSTSRPKGSSETVGAFLERWLEDAARHLRPRTVASYRTIIEHHIEPYVGHDRLRDLEPTDVSRMVTSVLAEKKSAQTAKHAHKVLRVALNQALLWGLVERNVATLVKPPRVVRKPVQGLTAEEAREFLKKTRKDPRWPLYVLAITTGMRRGELLALRWKDVNLKAGTVTVAATLRQVSEFKWAWDEPKTGKSRRTLTLSRLAVEALTEQKAKATTTGSVFARPDGRPLPPSEVSRDFGDLLVALKFRKIRFHDLRHTAAQLLLDQMGGDIRAVSATLGHSTIGTTVDIYGGMADEARKRSAAAMDKVMEGVG